MDKTGCLPGLHTVLAGALFVDAFLSSALVAVEEYEPPRALEVQNQRLVPFFNLSKNEQLTFHPYASVGGGYDSNVLLDSPGQEQDDTFAQGIIGAQIDWEPAPIDRLQIRGEYNRTRYQTYDAEAGVRGGSLQLGYHHEGLVWAGFVTGSWRRINDALLSTNERALVEVWNSEGRLDYRTLTTRSSLGVTWARDDYLDGTSSFTETSRDNQRYELYARFAHELTDSDSIYVRTGPTRTIYQEQTQYVDSSGWFGVVGSELALGSLTTLTAEGGVVYRDYAQELPSNPTLTGHILWAPLANIEATYLYEEQSWIRVTAFSSLIDSLSQSYGSYYFGGRLDVRKRLLTNAGLVGTIAISENRDVDAGTLPRESAVVRAFRGGGEYALREGLGIRALAGYEFSTADIADAYQRWIFSASINAAF
jgi:hypothetical protein